MPDLNSLGFTPDEEIPSDPIETIPESTGGFAFLQPGYYNFQFPDAEKGFTEESAVDEGFFKKILIDGKEFLQLTLRGGQDNEGNRKGYPLRVKGQGLYGTQFNNAPRTFQGKKVNDLLMLLKALGHTETPKTNLQYIQALLQYAGQSFRAEVSLSATAKAKDHGFDAKFASFVYFSNKRNKKPLDTPYTGGS